MKPTLPEIVELARRVITAGAIFIAPSTSSATSSAIPPADPSDEAAPTDEAASSSAGEATVKALDEYVEAVSSWQDEGTGVAPDEEPLLRELAETLHPQVLEVAHALKNDTSRAMLALRKKGRGLLAYADHLPNRVSVRRSQKG